MTNQYLDKDYILGKAQGYWPQILESLGINNSYLKNKHGPCPACGGKDRFRFDDRGIGRFICTRCGSGDGIKLLRICFGWDYQLTLKMLAEQLRLESSSRIISNPKLSINSLEFDKKKRLSRRDMLNSTWKNTQSITVGDPVSSYLATRGIILNEYPLTLKYHPSLPYFEDKKLIGKFPGMVALATDYKNTPVTLHRTYLGNNGKANLPHPKKLMSPVISGASSGASIKLFTPKNGELVLAEGIETALAIFVATKIPVWATINANGMEKVIIPTSIMDITIAVDNDESGCGQKSAFILSQRLLHEGRNVKRVIPPKIGSDFADMLLEVN
jgi:putative DNA primase/helicase